MGLRTCWNNRFLLVGPGVHAPPIDLSTTYPVPDRADGGLARQALADLWDDLDQALSAHGERDYIKPSSSGSRLLAGSH
ncbi:hypothetical protein ACQPZF_17910 [Actinosynnema sp. CS-041913]|uniref:hypothetical protein n=1 Tax=Actinosynnema sp. CS-041913 TaxID=3239917 RepID=UPI003D8AAE02